MKCIVNMNLNANGNGKRGCPISIVACRLHLAINGCTRCAAPRRAAPRPLSQCLANLAVHTGNTYYTIRLEWSRCFDSICFLAKWNTYVCRVVVVKKLAERGSAWRNINSYRSASAILSDSISLQEGP